MELPQPVYEMGSRRELFCQEDRINEDLQSLTLPAVCTRVSIDGWDVELSMSTHLTGLEPQV